MSGVVKIDITESPETLKTMLREHKTAALKETIPIEMDFLSSNCFCDTTGWNTWLRLLEYKPEPLADDRKHFNPEAKSIFGRYNNHLYISDCGRKYYEENYQRYRELYPNYSGSASHIVSNK